MNQQHEVLDRIAASKEMLTKQADDAERLCRLPDATAKALKDTGVIRLLQPKRYGGYEVDPQVFFRAVMEIASCCGASGWVSGIVGVHPWELGLLPDKAQEEVWGDDPDTWISSTYMPGGIAKPVDGGYILNGRWQFSSGSDHCDWIFLGGFLGDAEGNRADPPVILHMLLPRKDYQVIEDSWHVVGLSGTGSNDIVVRDAFVPAYRAMDSAEVVDPSGREHLPPTFRYPFSSVFPNAITASIIGISEGALGHVLDRQRERAQPRGGKPYADDPHSNAAIGNAAADIAASRAQLFSNLAEVGALIEAGQPIPMELRVRSRRDQVRGSWRAVQALDELFARSGGGALRTDNNPLQRLWRDAHAGLVHAINVPGPTMASFANYAMNRPLAEALI
ncbi:acyl-CoA dehydrogenase family protein [Amycolatopsis sp. GM8]|uniref:acyl-CoA dehydrogenase family protein n=1 Tax=Amycolatopsis sp. GM8 TaxID=2896530 RepID=UPI001F3A59EA|nr:acyl-CoA dehydrogenase family protein [Amycolatopsis sp. GM8]